MKTIRLIFITILIVSSRTANSQIDSNLLNQLHITHYRTISLNNKDTWQIFAVRFEGGFWLTKKGAILIDSTRGSNKVSNIKTYSISKGKVHLVSNKSYIQKDSIEICVKRYEYHKNGNIKRGWSDCRYDVKDYSAYKDEHVNGHKNGKYIWTFTDTNGITRIKSNSNYKVDYPNELTFYDKNGKKQFTLMLFRDTADTKLIASDTIFANLGELLGHHSYFIYRYVCNHLRDRAYLRTKDKLYYLRRNEFY